MKPLAQMALDVLQTALSHKYAAEWRAARKNGDAVEIGSANPPMHPARPSAPELLSPRDVPRRKPGSPEGRIALLHAVAHIELNAVDLHWDIIARFCHIPLPMGFYDDWVSAADDESKHFNLMCDCLEEWAVFTAPCLHMLACGVPQKTPQRISWGVWLSFRWC